MRTRAEEIELREKIIPLMEKQRKRERKLHPLRITDKLVLYVPMKKCNEEYKQWYIENRMGKQKFVNR